MENTAIILIVITLFLLVIIVGLLSVLIYKVLMNRPEITKEPISEFHPAIMERMKQLKSLKPRSASLFCPNHPEEPGEVSCAICDKIFCKSCVKSFKTLHFCKEHHPLVMREEWDEILTLKTSTTDPEKGVILYEVKKELFERDDIPTFIETHYKINIDDDYIETYLVLFGIKNQVMNLKEKFQARL